MNIALELNALVASLTQFSTRLLFSSLPVLMASRMVLSFSNLDSSHRILDSLKGAFSAILFIFIFKNVFPEVSEIIISLIDIETYKLSDENFGGFFKGLSVRMALGLSIVLKVIVYLSIILSLVTISLSLPVSFLIDRLFSLSSLLTINKLCITALLYCILTLFLTENALLTFGLDKDSTVNIIVAHIMKYGLSLMAFGYGIRQVLSYSPHGSKSSLDTLGNKLLYNMSPKLFEYNILRGLDSGRYKVTSDGHIADNKDLKSVGRQISLKHRDDLIAKMIKNGQAHSISEAQNRKDLPKSYKNLDLKDQAEKENLTKTIKDKKLTSVSDALLFTENRKAFETLNKNKSKKYSNEDKALSKLIKDKKALNIAEAKNLVNYPKSYKLTKKQSDDSLHCEDEKFYKAVQDNQALNIAEAKNLKSYPKTYNLVKAKQEELKTKEDALLSQIIDDSKAPSISEAKNFVQYPKAFESVQTSKKYEQKAQDYILSDVIEKGQALSVSEAKNQITFPKTAKVLKEALSKSQKTDDLKYSETITKEEMTSISDARLYHDMPNSWSAIKINRKLKGKG